MQVLVTGATGYIGGRLVPELLAAGHRVRCVARTPAKLDALPWRDDVEVVKADADDGESLGAAMEGCDAAYYLLHSMGTSGDEAFADRDRRLAETFRDAAAAAGLRQLVYLGGLGVDDDPSLSPHLASRHEVGRVLAAGPVPVTELRAAIIIGSGSASFEMLRHLTDVLPVMVAPRWVRTCCQPIAIRDVLVYLAGVLGNEAAMGRVLEIGGPDISTYNGLMDVYAEVAGLKRRRVLPSPSSRRACPSHWIGLVTPIPRASPGPSSRASPTRWWCTTTPSSRSSRTRRCPFRRSIELALERMRELEVATTWAGAELAGRSPADPMPTDPSWSGGVVLTDVKQVPRRRPAVGGVRHRAPGIGGTRGWYVTELLWSVRGSSTS
jgi:uncharacterized protein YbjT (DUF2867 family)